jgi:hypothetical protein
LRIRACEGLQETVGAAVELIAMRYTHVVVGKWLQRSPNATSSSREELHERTATFADFDPPPATDSVAVWTASPLKSLVLSLKPVR